MTIALKPLKLYLAHPFDARDEIKQWEKQLEKRIKINLVNPFYDAGGENAKEIDQGVRGRYDCDPQIIVEGDVGLIKDSDGIMSVINGELSYGTIHEKVYAKEMGRIDLSLITNGCEKDPWLVHHSSEIFTDLNSLTERLVELANSPEELEKIKKRKSVESVEKEIEEIKKSDKLITIIREEADYGTIMRLVYAHKFGVPTYTLVTNGHEEHFWLRYHSTKVFTKQKDLDKLLLKLN